MGLRWMRSGGSYVFLRIEFASGSVISKAGVGENRLGPGKGIVMRGLVIYMVWLGAAALVVSAVFAPNSGLIHGGAGSAAGVGLLGLGVMVHMRRARQAD